MKLTLLAGVLVVLLGCASRDVGAAQMAIAQLQGADGQPVGVATLVEGSGGVAITVNLYGMPPGTHAFHIHAAGSCDRPGFKSAQGHFNPYSKKHGLKNPEGPHAGDLLNITIGSDGTGAFVLFAPLVTLGSGPNSLFREGGTAVMIHEGPDDYMTDPAGAAGPRIACGVIEVME